MQVLEVIQDIQDIQDSGGSVHSVHSSLVQQALPLPPLLSTLPEVTPSLACSEEGRATTPLYSDPDGLSYTWCTQDGLREETVTSSAWPPLLQPCW